MSKKVDQVLAEEGEAGENYEMPEELPPDVEVGRPNLGKATVVSVRLSRDEHRRLQEAAEEANLPVSTLIRVWALDRLRAEEQGDGGSVSERLARLEKAVFQRSA
ncbi:MAG TPA: CopG family transcriptional regulator [Acidimicrobiales bacterium]|nr:CopG family transcriptional regulator [Acidimicrobiales bacterium]